MFLLCSFGCAMKERHDLGCGMELVSFLLCFLFGRHSPDKRGYCRHCGVKARDD
jgi:hypothetical protein